MGGGKSKPKAVPDVERSEDEMQMSKDKLIDDVSNKNKINFIGLLPLEIWDEILDVLKDPKDILICSEVCNDWNLLLEPKITSAYFGLILPKVAKFLDKADFLSCSAVSKSLNYVVDTTIQTIRTDAMYRLQSAIDDDDDDTNTFPCLRLRSARKIEEVLSLQEAFGGSQYDNPVAYRRVIVKELTTEEMSDEVFTAYWQLLSRFLQRFGKYIHQLDFFGYECDFVKMMRILHVCLTHTPNLKVFSFDFAYGDVDEEDEEPQLVDDFLAGSPFPDSTLKVLRMPYSPLPRKIVEVMILRYGNQLEYLPKLLSIPVTKLIPRGLTFENLKVLRVDLRLSNNGLDFLAYLFRELKWNLTELYVTVDEEDYSKRSLKNFFQALRKYPFCTLHMRESTRRQKAFYLRCRNDDDIDLEFEYEIPL